jgi:hypothetical protein
LPDAIFLGFRGKNNSKNAEGYGSFHPEEGNIQRCILKAWQLIFRLYEIP